MFPYFSVAALAVILAAVSTGISRRAVALRASRSRESTLDATSEKPRSTLFDVFAVVILIAFPALRASTVGTDTMVYARIFEVMPPDATWEYLQSVPQEIGYTLLSSIVKSWGGDFTTLLWVNSAIAVIAAYWALRRTSKNFVAGLALYVLLTTYLLQFNVLRQGVAVSLIFLAATFLAKRRGWLAYVLLAALATSFHSTALIAAILLPVFMRWKVTPRGLLGASAIVAGFTAALWASPWLLSVVEVLNPRYTGYIDWHVEAGIGIYLTIAAQLAILLYATFLRPSNDDMRYAAWSAIGIAWLIIGTQSVVASRIGSYFLVFLCVLLPNVMRDRNVPRAHMVALILFSALFFGFSVANYGSMVPYRW